MQVIYDGFQDAYIVQMEYPDTVIYINSKDIVEAREIFIEHMTAMFNRSVCEQLKIEQELFR